MSAGGIQHSLPSDLRHVEPVEDGTRNRYRAYLRNDLIRYSDALLPVDAINDVAVPAWVNWLEHEVGNAPETIANKHGFLFAFMASLIPHRAGRAP